MSAPISRKPTSKMCLQKNWWLPDFPVALSPPCIDLCWDNNGLIQPNVMYASAVFQHGQGKQKPPQGLAHKTKPWLGAISHPLPTGHLCTEICPEVFHVRNPRWMSWESWPTNGWVESRNDALRYQRLPTSQSPCYNIPASQRAISDLCLSKIVSSRPQRLTAPFK